MRTPGSKISRSTPWRRAGALRALGFAAALAAGVAGLGSDASAKTLPRMAKQVEIGGPGHRLLRDALGSRQEEIAGPLDDSVARMLVDALPEPYRSGCGEMIAQWGEVARGSAVLSVRGLYVGSRASGAVQVVVLAYRCASRAREYRDFYDERLAVLAIDARAARLALIPVGDPTDTLALSRLRLDQVVRLDGRPVVRVVMSTSSDNPCCGGSDSYAEEREHWYLLDGRDVKEVASVVRHRRETSHDDEEEGDSETVYAAAVAFESDPSGRGARIVSRYAVTVDGKPVKKGVLEYRWNGTKETFEQTGR